MHMPAHRSYHVLGRLDDAAGRLRQGGQVSGLGYPGRPVIDRLSTREMPGPLPPGHHARRHL